MSPLGLGMKNHCAGEDQQEISSQLVSELDNRSSKLVFEVRGRSRTQRKEDDCRWKSLRRNGSEAVTMDTSMCVIVKCEMYSRTASNRTSSV
jgi:hypothetical protein